MYDEDALIISLTDDEITILKEVLKNRLESCLSLGEQVTIEELIEKLN
jgi:hypothetical protein